MTRSAERVEQFPDNRLLLAGAPAAVLATRKLRPQQFTRLAQVSHLFRTAKWLLLELERQLVTAALELLNEFFPLLGLLLVRFALGGCLEQSLLGRLQLLTQVLQQGLPVKFGLQLQVVLGGLLQPADQVQALGLLVRGLLQLLAEKFNLRLQFLAGLLQGAVAFNKFLLGFECLEHLVLGRAQLGFKFYNFLLTQKLQLRVRKCLALHSLQKLVHVYLS